MNSTLIHMEQACRNEVGYHEGPKNNETKYGAWFGFNFVAWCAIFLSWCAARIGLMYLGKPWRFASTITARDHAKKNNRWITKPTVGTIAMMAHTATTGHVGYVIALLMKSGVLYVVTIEGNTNAQGSREGDQVAIRTRAASSWDGYIVMDDMYKNDTPTPPPIKDFLMALSDDEQREMLSLVKQTRAEVGNLQAIDSLHQENEAEALKRLQHLIDALDDAGVADSEAVASAVIKKMSEKLK